MSFTSFTLSEPLLRAINESGYQEPTAIQKKTVPAILSGRDVMATAQTGTGKTAGFSLPLLERLVKGPKAQSNQVRALVLAPTRELVVQISESIALYGKYLSVTSAVVYGGVKINPQMMNMRKGRDILVATPGRLLDLFNKNAVNFDQVETLVLDEADRMLDMGFIGDIRKILALLPGNRQNLLFSATFSTTLQSLAKTFLNNPLQIDVAPRNSAAKSVKQYLYEVDKTRKTALLCHLISHYKWQHVLVFVRTKEGADRLVKKLGQNGIAADAIHGDKRQGERSRVLTEFKGKKIRILVATELASRGLDIDELPLVINFDLPKVAGDYVHRIGRTGRAGLSGEAISLVSADEVKLLVAIESLINKTLVREVETNFVPQHGVPLTRLMKVRPKKPKKPKKPKQGKQQQSLRSEGDQNNEHHHQPRRGRRVRDEDPVSAKSPRGKRRQSGSKVKKKK